MLIRVVLPEPEGPIIAIHSPSSTVKETSSRAQTLPNSLRRFSIWTTVGILWSLIIKSEAKTRP